MRRFRGRRGLHCAGGRTEGTAGKRVGDVRPLPASTSRRRPRSPEKRRQPRGWGAFVTGRGRGCAGLIVLPPPFFPPSLGAAGSVALRPFPPGSPLLTVPAAGPDAAVRGGWGAPAAAGRAGPPGWGSPPGLTARLGCGPGTFPGLLRPFVRRGGSRRPGGVCHRCPWAAGLRRSSAGQGRSALSPGRADKLQRANARAPRGQLEQLLMLLCRAAGPARGCAALMFTCAVAWQPLGRRGAPALQPSPRLESRRVGETLSCPSRPWPCVWWQEGNPSVGLRQGCCIVPAGTTGMSGCRKLVYIGVQDMLEGNASSPVVSVGLVACIVKWLNVSSGMSDHTPAEPSCQQAGSILPAALGWMCTL